MDSVQAKFINEMVNEIHSNNVKAGWYTNLKYRPQFEVLRSALPDSFSSDQIHEMLDNMGIKRSGHSVPEKIALIHSEASEALEGDRKSLMDDKLPHRKMFEVELADIVIRVFDLAGAEKLDLGGAIVEKLNYNANRADHKIENRLQENGKAY